MLPLQPLSYLVRVKLYIRHFSLDPNSYIKRQRNDENFNFGPNSYIKLHKIKRQHNELFLQPFRSFEKTASATDEEASTVKRETYSSCCDTVTVCVYPT